MPATATPVPSAPAAAALREKDLKQWRLIERFQDALAAELKLRGGPADTWAHPNRELQLPQYLSLFLFGLFNPVVETMRGLCAATALQRVQREVSGAKVSLGSFSEAQAVVDPALLKAVFARLASEAPAPPAARASLGGKAKVVDSSVWEVLPRMAWAFWRNQDGLQNAVRLHVEFDLASGRVQQAELTKAKRCERQQWQKFAQPGVCHIGDRNFGQDYALLAKLQAKGSHFVVRLRLDTQWVEENSELLTAADRAAGVKWAGTVRLGKHGDGPRVRVIQLLGEDESILIATTLSAVDGPPELIAECYRHRWQVELFFRWLKCILGCRHWLAESERGVALQVYLALIAAQLMMLYQGERPNKRQMEAIQFYLMGWATLEELMARLKPAKSKKKSSAAKKS
ncbi:MAG: IS4 family transposase [Opitutaceae bacterium]|nr:IS4 family transposase [Opitutaceae bacterium]